MCGLIQDAAHFAHWHLRTKQLRSNLFGGLDPILTHSDGSSDAPHLGHFDNPTANCRGTKCLWGRASRPEDRTGRG
jgi:hypothetical protein